MSSQLPIGRFAPSPTGVLHLGSLATALASYCHIKALGGQWLLRIEDTDFERCKPAFCDAILYDLDKLGLHWDKEVVYQSQRLDIYDDYLSQLSPLLYPCHCSRKKLASQDNPIYPRHCTPTAGLSSKIEYTQAIAAQGNKIRLQLPDYDYVFQDKLQGIQWQNPQRLLGDVVIKRNNGMINYIFACAIDDGLQHISHIMRGIDILPMTAAQLFIQQSLGLTTPDHFYHLPLVLNPQGQKLSKQNLARALNTQNPSHLLCTVLQLLGQNPPSDLWHSPPTQILAYAIKHWDNRPLQYQNSFAKPYQ